MSSQPHSSGPSAYTPEPAALATAATRAQTPCPCSEDIATMKIGRSYPFPANTVHGNGATAAGPFQAPINPNPITNDQELAAYLNEVVVPYLRDDLDLTVIGGFIADGPHMIMPRVNGACLAMAIIPEIWSDEDPVPFPSPPPS